MSVNVVSPSTGALSPIASRGQFIQYSVMPTPSVDIVNKIVQYIGTTTASYTNGYFYKCVLDGSVYVWENVQVQSASGGSAVDSVNGKTGTVVLDAKDIGFQVDTMPTAESAIVNQVVQYTGTTTANYTNGYFYKCTTDGSTYSWTNIEVQTSGASSDNVVEGYFNSTDNLFYEESTYITPIVGASNVIYVSLDTDLLYRYNGSIFIRVDDVTVDSDIVEGYYNTTDGKFYEESTYITEITGETGKIYISLDTNVQYRYDGSSYVTIGGSIPVASSSVLGGVKVGTDLDIDANGVLSTNLGLVVDNGKLCVRYSVDEP